jgi:hypothetical protein
VGSSPDEGGFFSMYLIFLAALWPWGSTRSLTEMRTRNLPGGKGRPARRADNLTAICDPFSIKCGSLDVSEPYGPSRPATRIVYILYSSGNCVYKAVP